MTRSLRHAPSRGRSEVHLLELVWLGLLSLSLLLGGPGHVAFHGSGDACHSSHGDDALAYHEGHSSGFDPSEHSEGTYLLDLASDEDSGDQGLCFVHDDEHGYSEHDCIHCIQLVGEVVSVSLLPMGRFGDDAVRLEHRDELLGNRDFGVPSPRGPPTFS